MTLLCDAMGYNGPSIKKMVGYLEAKGLTFTYIGTGHDVQRAAVEIAIANVMKFDKNEDSMNEMFLCESQSRVLYSQNIRNKKETTKGLYENE